MKKLLILSCVVLSLVLLGSTVMAKGTLELKAGFDLGGTLESETTEEDADSGVTITGEYVVPYKDRISLGGGFSYQLLRGYDGGNDAKFGFMPFYGLARFNMEDTPAYVVGHLGYNTFTGNDDFKGSSDLDGGLYYGFGLGMKMTDKFNGEFLYSVNNGKFDDEDVKYTKMRLSVGTTF